MEKSDIRKAKDYYVCPRCKINSLGKQMCPCPRGGCEAKITGTITTRTVVSVQHKLTSEQKQWNKDNHR